MFEINPDGEISARPGIEPETPGLQTRLDANPIELIGYAFE